MRKWARNLKAGQKQETRAEEEGEAIMGRGRKNNINLAIVADIITMLDLDLELQIYFVVWLVCLKRVGEKINKT